MGILARFASLAAASGVAVATLVPGGAAYAQATGTVERAELSPMERVPQVRADYLAEQGEDEGSRVFGGMEAQPGAHPFQVALLTKDYLDNDPMSQFNAQFCGGSLIAPEWVLTASHCVVDEQGTVPANSISILVGATDLTEGTRHDVAEVIAHPDYSMTTLNADIALIRLAKPADAPTIRIATDEVTAGAATVTGWGRMEDGYFPIRLMQADLELQQNATCNAGLKDIYSRDIAGILTYWSGRMRYSPEGIVSAASALAGTMSDPLNETMLCAGTVDGMRDSCNGDSGGPLFMREGNDVVQVGVVSWGDGPVDAEVYCGHKGAYGVYSNVAHFAVWIAENTGIAATAN